MAAGVPSTAQVLFEQVQSEVREEEDVRRTSETIRQDSPDPGARFLMGLVVEDEARREQLLATIAEGVRDSRAGAGVEQAIPPVESTQETRARLSGEVARLMTLQRRRLRRLRDLQKAVQWAGDEDSRAIYDLAHSPVEAPKTESTSKWLRSSPIDLLLDMMIDDTRRDMRLLEYMREHVEHPRDGHSSLLRRLSSVWGHH